MSYQSEKTILLVEEKAILALTGKMLLEKYGYKIITADSGEKAVESVDKIPGIDLVLMDINLGSGIDGTQAAEKILKSHDIPLVFLSSHTEPEVVNKTEKITSYGYVVKNSGITVLDASIKMAFKLFDAHVKLQKSERRLNSIFENVPIGMFQSTKEGKFVNVNKALPGILGYESKEELIGTVNKTSIAEALYVDPALRPVFVKQLDQSSPGWQVFENRYLKKDGSIIDAVLTFSEEEDPIKGMSFLNGFVEGVTDRKHSEETIKEKNEELEAANEELTTAMEEMEAANEELLSANEELIKSEEKYRLLFLNMDSYNSMYEVVTDNEGKPCDFRFIMVNRAYENYVGKKASELVGKTLLEVYPETEQYWIDAMTKAVLTGEPLRLENFSRVMNTYSEINLYTPQKGQLAMTTANIDDRKKIEVALRESEERYRVLHNASFGGIAIHDNGKILECNQGLSEMTGYSRDELISMEGYLFIAPDSREIVKNNVKKDFEKSYEAYGIRKNGEIFPMRIEGRRVPYKGKMVRAVEFRDITERKQLKETLQESEAKYKALFDNVTDSIFIYNPDTFEILQANDATSKLYGYDKNDLIGMSCLKFSAEVDQSKTVAAQIINEGMAIVPSRHHRKNDGSDLYVQLTGYKVIVNGKDLMFSVCRDITQQKQIEQIIFRERQFLENILMTTSDGFCLVNNDKRITFVNNAYCKMTGYLKEEVLAMTINDFDADESQVETDSRTQRIVKNGNEIFETRHRRKDGSVFDIEISSTFSDMDGGCFMCFCRDITEKKKKEVELLKSERTLKFVLQGSQLGLWD